jgi:S1-C subfamily serine protease
LLRRMGVQGPMIFRVIPDSAAARAGLRGLDSDEGGNLIPGDVILEVEGRPVRDTAELFTALGRHSVGDRVTLTVHRVDETIKVPITLDGDTPSQN